MWYIFGDPPLVARGKSSVEAAATDRRKIAISVISLAEIVYPIEKARIPSTAYGELRRALHDPNHVLQEAPVTGEIIDAMQQIPRADKPDLPDRIVAATAVFHGVPVISRDGLIRASSIRTVGRIRRMDRLRVRPRFLTDGFQESEVTRVAR